MGWGRQGGWCALTAHPAVHPSEQPERLASTCPRVTPRIETVQVRAREAVPGRGPPTAPQPRREDAVSCPGQAQPLRTVGCEQAASALLGWLPHAPCPAWPRAPGGAPSHSSPWHPPSLGCWHGNRPPGTPRTGTTVSGGQLVGRRGEVGTGHMGVVAGWEVACLFLGPPHHPQVAQPVAHTHVRGAWGPDRRET